MEKVLNSGFVQFALRFGMSKLGPLALGAATWLAAHILIWFGLPHFVDPAQLAKIQTALTESIDKFEMGMVAVCYAWIVHRQSLGVKILKQQLDSAAVPTPEMALKSGAVGNATLLAAEAVTG